jgi:hypothetical protein
VLAVQEVGDPVALGELADRVGGTWHIETAAPETGTAHTIRVGVLSRLPLTTFDPVEAFPDKLRAIQQGDKPGSNGRVPDLGDLLARETRDIGVVHRDRSRRSATPRRRRTGAWPPTCCRIIGWAFFSTDGWPPRMSCLPIFRPAQSGRTRSSLR